MYNIKKSDFEKMIETYMDAFSKYPKLMGVFKENKKRLNALEATLRYYAAYDLHFGQGIALDNKVNEAILFVHSDEMKYTKKRHEEAGSYSDSYKKVMNKLTKKDQIKWLELFDELDRMEENLDIPESHLYVDFLGVKTNMQKQGRGSKLIKEMCSIARIKKLPIMLFTNTPEDVVFYENFGFKQIGKTKSEKFKFENVYMVKKK